MVELDFRGLAKSSFRDHMARHSGHATAAKRETKGESLPPTKKKEETIQHLDTVKETLRLQNVRTKRI